MTGPGPVASTPAAVSGAARDAWSAALRVVVPWWLLATGLRYLTAAIVEYRMRPEHGRLGRGVLGVLLLPADFDSGYYKDIATTGYFDPTFSRAEFPAFFPGYPLVMRAVAAVTTWQVTTTRVLVAGAVISAVCSLIAAVVLYRLTTESTLLRAGENGRRAGSRTVLILMFWPTATFLSAVYSESLYLALAVGAWWNARRGRWWWAGLLCAGASLTRINGLFLMVALFVLLLTRVVGGQERLSPGRLAGKVAAVALGGVGAAGYLGWLWWRTGDPMAWSTAQRLGWARDTVTPWTALTNTVGGIRETSDPLRAAQWIIDIGAVVLLVALLVYLLRHRWWAEATLTFLTVAVLATSSNYLSIMRNTLTVFPLFLVAGVLLARRSSVTSTGVLAVSGLWMLGTTVTFTLTQWSG